jgi:hypothetical protein
VNPEEIAAQALTELEGTSESALAQLRADADAARTRVENALEELRVQAGLSASGEASQEVWDLDSSSESSADLADDVSADVPSVAAAFEDDGPSLIVPLSSDFEIPGEPLP